MCLFNSLDTEVEELDMLISQLPKGDLDDEIPEGGLTDREIIDAILNKNKEEDMADEDEFSPISEKISLTEAENSMMRFLYEQRPEFGEVNEELKVLRGLHRRVKLLIVKNLKQADIHNYFCDIFE